MELKRTDIILKPNNARVLFRPFEPADRNRAMRIVARVMSMSDEEIERLGLSLLRLSEKLEEIKLVFGLEGEELNIDLGPLGKLL